MSVVVQDPFSAPSAPFGLDVSDLSPATLGDRFVARIVDNLATFGTLLPGGVVVGVADSMDDGSTGEIALLAVGGLLLLAALIGMAVLQAWWLTTRGQSVGKRVIGIRVVKLDGTPADFASAVLLRSWLPNFVIGVANQLCLGWVLVLADVAPLLFGAEQRCLHDYIAGTRVVHGGPEMLD